MGKAEAVIEDKQHFTVGADAWCWIEAGKVNWTGARFDVGRAGQTWRQSASLPNGVRAGDVKALVPGRATVTLFTRDAAYGLECDSGRWSQPMPLFDGGAR